MQGYAIAVPWLALGELQHGHQHPVESFQLRSNQAERHHHPNLLVEASINYDGNIIDITNSANCQQAGGLDVTAVLRQRLPIRCPAYTGLEHSVQQQKDMGSAPWHNAAQDYMPKVDISYTTGKHAMKFGFSYNRYTKNQQLFGDRQGSVDVRAA